MDDDDHHEDDGLSSDDEECRLPDGSIYNYDHFEELNAGTHAWDEVYGQPLAPEEAAARVPPGAGGAIWHARLVYPPKAGAARSRASSVLDKDGKLKPRRPTPAVRAGDFFASLAKTPDGRYIFCGVLNGWPGLQHLEVRAITRRSLLRGGFVDRLWDAASSDAAPRAPSGGKGSVRVTLRGAPWTDLGWARRSPGWTFWYFATGATKRFVAGRDMIDACRAAGEPPRATRAHIFVHRFALPVGRAESAEQRLTNHSVVVVEWSHGRYVSLVELGNRHRLGCNRGKLNWLHGVEAETLGLLPTSMLCPWVQSRAEARCTDVPFATVDAFLAYVDAHTGPGKKFLAPVIQCSSAVRIVYNTKEDIARFVVNYMARDHRYHKTLRNCQYFAGDLFGFICGKKYVKPFNTTLEALYAPRYHTFLYDPALFNVPAIDDADHGHTAAEVEDPKTPVQNTIHEALARAKVSAASAIKKVL